MKPAATSGFVADGYWRYTRSEEFQARERAVRAAVAAEFVPRLAAARGMRERWRVRWEEFLVLRRELRALHPSPHSCYLVSPGEHAQSFGYFADAHRARLQPEIDESCSPYSASFVRRILVGRLRAHSHNQDQTNQIMADIDCPKEPLI